MKKIIAQYSVGLQPFFMITALMLAMISEDAKHLLLQWLALSVLWVMTLWGFAQSKRRYLGLRKDKVFWSYVLFVAWAGFSSFFLSSAKFISILMLIPFIGGILSYVIAYIGNEKKDRYFDQLLLVIGLLLVAYTCYQKFYLGMNRPIGLLMNWNSHAALLAMIVLPWVLIYALKPVLAVWKMTLISLMAGVFAFAMGLTLSRGALLIPIVSLFCLLIFVWRQKMPFRSSFAFIAAFILGVLLTSFFAGETLVQRLDVISHADSLAAVGSGRHLLWLPAWQMYLDKPFTGWGLGTFQFLYAQYKPLDSGELGYFAHNDYLQFLLELGPIGLLLFMVFVSFLVIRLVFLIVAKNRDAFAHRVQAFAFLAISIGMLAHTFFTFHFYHLTMQLLFAYYLGRSARHFYLLKPEQSVVSAGDIPSQNTGLLYRSFAVIVSVFMLCFGASLYYLKQAEQALNDQARLDAYWQASLFFPAIDYYDSFGSFLLSKQLQREGNKSLQREKIAKIALNSVNIAIEKMPFHARNYETKANILQMMPVSASEVQAQYAHALTVDPSKLDIRDGYAHYLVEQGQYDKAQRILWEAWGQFYRGAYQQAISLLSYQLEINERYGKAKYHSIIEQERQRLIQLNMRRKEGGYILTRADSDM